MFVHVVLFISFVFILISARDGQPVQEVRAGHVFGLGGVEGIVLKTATLASSLLCSPFTPMEVSSAISYAISFSRVSFLPFLLLSLLAM